MWGAKWWGEGNCRDRPRDRAGNAQAGRCGKVSNGEGLFLLRRLSLAISVHISMRNNLNIHFHSNFSPSFFSSLAGGRVSYCEEIAWEWHIQRQRQKETEETGRAKVFNEQQCKAMQQLGKNWVLSKAHLCFCRLCLFFFFSSNSLISSHNFNHCQFVS